MHITQAELTSLTAEHLAKAAASPHGRSAHAVLRDGKLRHTLMAITDGSRLADHTKPASATLLVLQGSVTVNWSGGEPVVVEQGGLYVLPDAVHNVVANGDSAFLLTTLAG